MLCCRTRAPYSSWVPTLHALSVPTRAPALRLHASLLIAPAPHLLMPDPSAILTFTSSVPYISSSSTSSVRHTCARPARPDSQQLRSRSVTSHMLQGGHEVNCELTSLGRQH